MKLLLVANPVSGGGKAGRLARRLTELLERDGHAVELYLTRGAGDGRDRVGRIEGVLDRIVVVGGDGTLNEVLNGLRDPSAVPLCQLATGTANILAHELKLPRKPEQVAQLIRSGRVRRLDVGIAGTRRFLMVVSAGFDAMVTRDILQHRTGKLGYTGYVLPILRTLASYRPPRIELRIDDEPPIHGGLVVVSNTRNYGGLFVLADRARVDSGHLDVCVLENGSLARLLGAAVAGLRGGLSRRRGVIYRTGSRIRLSAAEPLPVQVDGDSFGETPLDIGLVPAHLPFVVPADQGD